MIRCRVVYIEWEEFHDFKGNSALSYTTLLFIRIEFHYTLQLHVGAYNTQEFILNYSFNVLSQVVHTAIGLTTPLVALFNKAVLQCARQERGTLHEPHFSQEMLCCLL